MSGLLISPYLVFCGVQDEPALFPSFQQGPTLVEVAFVQTAVLRAGRSRGVSRVGRPGIHRELFT